MNRTFCEYLHRYRDLEMRAEKVRRLWDIYSDMNPFISLFRIRKFNRILRKIHEQKIAETENKTFIINKNNGC